MKDMKTKVVALMLVIPLLLIFTTSSVVKTTEILVDVPVSSVEIEGDATRFVDVAQGQPVELQAVVLPDNATNKSVTYTVEAVPGQKEAQVLVQPIVDENNTNTGKVRIVPLSTGHVNVVANAAGGRMDKVQLVFSSTKPLGNDVTIKDGDAEYNLIENEKLRLKDEINNPDNYILNFEWSSSDTSVASVNAFGNVTALRQGTAVISAGFTGISIDPVTGAVDAKDYVLQYPVSVSMPADKDVSFGSGNNQQTTLLDGEERTAHISFSYNRTKYGSLTGEDLLSAPDMLTDGMLYLDYDRDQLQIDIVSIDTDKGTVEVAITVKDGVDLPVAGLGIHLQVKGNAQAVGSVLLNLKDNDPIDDTPVKNVWFDQDSLTGVVLLQQSTTTSTLYAELEADATDPNAYYVVYTSSNDAVLKVMGSGNYCWVSAQAEGTALIYPTVYDALTDEMLFSADPSVVTEGDDNYIRPLEVAVCNPLTELTIDYRTLQAAVYKDALDSSLTVGYYSFADGSADMTTLQPFQMGQLCFLGLLNNHSQVGTQESAGRVQWESSDESVAVIDDNGNIRLTGGNGTVTFTVRNSDAVLAQLAPLSGTSYDRVTASFTVDVRNRGVNIVNDDQLYAACRNGQYEMVLLAPISLGDELLTVTDYDHFDYKAYAERYTSTMACTADNTYYRNVGMPDQSRLRYAIDVTNNLYGNGYSVNADCLTRVYAAKSGDRIYRGPINLVSYTNNQTKENMAVKSQDSIIFVVNRDNITMTNVELKGCLDQSLQNESGSADLTNLDYCGTVLEVVGDNCTLSYSRVNNGRTAVRVFGSANTSAAITAANADNYRVHTTINNCILSHAREFILKIGTNQLRRMPVQEHPGVYLNTQAWTAIDEAYWEAAAPHLLDADGRYYDSAADHLDDEYFYNNYVLTDIVLRDCVFSNAGLFSVGLNSMFGGLVLHSWDYSETYGFKTWRGTGGTSYPAVLRLQGDVRFYDWKPVDSVNSDTLLEGADTSMGQIIGFKMNIADMINSQKNSNLVSRFDGKDYVNGAIAFFGGGHNYSAVDVSGANSAFTPLNSYTVPVESMAGDRVQFLYYTAGKDPFRFLLYDNNSSLGVATQTQHMQENTAYNWLRK